MGRVWVAEHLTLDTNVVVKFMAVDVAATADGAARFAREASVAAAVKSPHVVQVFDHGVTNSKSKHARQMLTLGARQDDGLVAGVERRRKEAVHAHEL